MVGNEGNGVKMPLPVLHCPTVPLNPELPEAHDVVGLVAQVVGDAAPLGPEHPVQ